MKKYIFLLLVGFFVFFGGVGLASAQTNETGSPTPLVERRAAVQDRMMNRASTTGTSTRVQAMQEQRAEHMERLSEARKEMIRNFAKRMFRRMEAAIERITKLGERLEARIAKLKERGIDTAKAEELLATSKTELATATAKLAEAKQAAEEAVNSEDPKTAFKEVRGDVDAARDAIKKAHRALVDAVASLKGKSGTRGTTTPATSN